MNCLNRFIIDSNYIRVHLRPFSRTSRSRSRSMPARRLTDDEINAKIRELQLMKMQNQPVQKSPGFLQIIKDGFAHGIGWSIAGRLMDKIIGPRSMEIFSPHSDNSPMNSHDSLGTGESFSDNSVSNDEGWSWGDDLFDDE